MAFGKLIIATVCCYSLMILPLSAQRVSSHPEIKAGDTAPSLDLRSISGEFDLKFDGGKLERPMVLMFGSYT